MFNPLKYQYLANFLQKEDGEASVSLKLGAKEHTLKIPLDLLPTELEPGEDFILKMLPAESAKSGDYETMRKILEDLIN